MPLLKKQMDKARRRDPQPMDVKMKKVTPTESVTTDTDDLLDEIDEVLENVQESFAVNYRQVGGQ